MGTGSNQEKWKHQINRAQLKLIKTTTNEIMYKRPKSNKIKQEVPKWGNHGKEKHLTTKLKKTSERPDQTKPNQIKYRGILNVEEKLISKVGRTKTLNENLEMK